MTNTTPDNHQTATAIVDFEAWDVPAVFMGANAEARATAFLLEQTAGFREGMAGHTDAEWLDICLSEGWDLWTSEADGSNANWDL